jgi:putative aldouronate transport system permease protein
MATAIAVNQRLKRKFDRRTLPLYFMFLPGLILFLLFTLLPLFGVIVAFQDYNPMKGFLASPFVGFKHFQTIFNNPQIGRLLVNTVSIAVGKIIANQLFSLLVAILLNEVIHQWLKRWVQTMTYLLYFLSWVVFGGIVLDLLGYRGIIATAFDTLLGHSHLYMQDPNLFRIILIATDVWKNFGYGAVVYLAALTSVDPVLIEAACVDGAGRFGRIWHVSLPSILPTIVLLACLSLGNVMNAGFDQVYMLYSPLVYSTGDILDTYIYRIGLQRAEYGLGAAVGLLKSIVGFGLITLSFYLAKRFTGYRVL